MNLPCTHARAGQALPTPATLGWILLSGLVCYGPAFEGTEVGTGVHALAQPGDLILPGNFDELARALMPCELAPLREPQTRQAWRTLLMQASRQQRRQAADLASLRSGPAADRVRHLLLMLAGPDAPPQRLPSLRTMAALLDIAPETVSRVVSALRQMRLLEAGAPHAARSACHAARQLAAQPLPPGLTSSRTSRRIARANVL